MDSKIWNERYSVSDYIYGVQPNIFFKQYIDNNKAGNLLLPAEGEGRNAVYAASKGWNVEAFDISEIARTKAINLASINNVSINYKICDILNYEVQTNNFDLIAIIYFHFQHSDIKFLFNKLFSSLKKGGCVLFEAFEKKQINFISGGPKVEKMLYSIDEVKEFFTNFYELNVWEEKIFLNEGLLHNGEAQVVRAIAKK